MISRFLSRRDVEVSRRVVRFLMTILPDVTASYPNDSKVYKSIGNPDNAQLATRTLSVVTS